MSWRLAAHSYRHAAKRDARGYPVKIVKYTRGDIVEGLSDEDVQRLLKAGAIVDTDATDDASADGPGAGDPAPSPGDGQPAPTGDPAPATGEPERPAQTATKEAWEQYAIAKGVPEEQAKAATRQDLIAALSS